MVQISGGDLSRTYSLAGGHYYWERDISSVEKVPHLKVYSASQPQNRILGEVVMIDNGAPGVKPQYYTVIFNIGI